MSDRVGRTKVVLFCYITVLGTGLITSFLPNLWLFETIRILTGMFAPGTYMVMVVLSSEIVSEKLRPAAGMIYWIFYSGGVAILGVKAFYIHNWRKLLMFGSGPYLITIVLLWFLPESFVWLLAHRKDEELIKTIKTIARINGKETPNNIIIKHERQETESDVFVILLLFKPSSRLFKTLPMMFSWFSIGIIYFGEPMAANDLTGNEYRDFILLALVDIPAAGTAILLAMWLGRKKTVMVAAFLGGLSIGAVGLFPENSVVSGYSSIYLAYVISRLTFGISAKFFCSVMFDVIVTWCAELYPTKLRSNANGLFNSSLILGGMCAPWICIWLHNVNKSAPFYAMGGSMILSSIMLCRIAETKGLNLPQRLISTRVGETRGNDNNIELEDIPVVFHDRSDAHEIYGAQSEARSENGTDNRVCEDSSNVSQVFVCEEGRQHAGENDKSKHETSRESLQINSENILSNFENGKVNEKAEGLVPSKHLANHLEISINVS